VIILDEIQDVLNKVDHLVNEEKYEDALILMENLFRNNPYSEEIKKKLLGLLFSYGGYLNDEFVLKYERAAEIFKRIVEIDPQNYRGHYNLGIAYFNLNQLENALSACNEAIRIKPDYKHCFYNIGLIYEKNNDLEKALEFYEKTLEIDPKFPYALHARKEIRKFLDVMKGE
jgi:tetratricopeptide (TPR) repeat protein